jgi:hypothetical protein
MNTFTTAALAILGDRYADDYQPTPDEASAILAEERRLNSQARAAEVRAQAEAKARTETDPVAERRAQAQKLRQEREERASLIEDAREIVRHEHPGYGDMDELADDEVLVIAGFVKTQAQIDADLAADIDANLAAANQARPKWVPNAPPDTPFIADKAKEGADA